jgi:integrase
MSRGCITRRGKRSWRIKLDLPADATGERQTRYLTVKGLRKDAERELARLLSAVHDGTFVEPSKLTVTDYLRSWLAGLDVAGTTAERYRLMVEQQAIPHLGAIPLQKLRPAQVQAWHQTLLQRGGKDGRPLATRTVAHCHAMLRTALAKACALEIINRNVASVVSPPKVQTTEIRILNADEIAIVLASLTGHRLYPLAALALGSGARRGELLALAWGHLDLDGARLTIERSLEETSAGRKFKAPKNKHSRRTISLPASAVDAMRQHRLQQLEQRVALGLGKLPDDALVFCTIEGEPLWPDNVSRDWRVTVAALGLPEVSLHGLRHTHASALIAAGMDVLSISRRLGHSSPTITLNVYAHLFRSKDDGAADAIESIMRRK